VRGPSRYASVERASPRAKSATTRAAGRVEPDRRQPLGEGVGFEAERDVDELRWLGHTGAGQHGTLALLGGRDVDFEHAGLAESRPEPAGAAVVAGAEQDDLWRPGRERVGEDAVEVTRADEEVLVGAGQLLQDPLARGAVVEGPPALPVVVGVPRGPGGAATTIRWALAR